MNKMGPWGPVPDAAPRRLGLPFLPGPPPARRAVSASGSGLEGKRDRLMAERDRLSMEIGYLDAQSLPRARETALNSVALAESRMTETAFDRAAELGGMVESMTARRAALGKELGEVKARLCETLEAISGGMGGRP